MFSCLQFLTFPTRPLTCVLLAAMLALLLGCRQDAAPPDAAHTANGGSATETPASAPPAPSDVPLPAGTLDAELWADGWISLFDGETLFGWEAGSDADWRVEDGAIVVSSGEKGLLTTTTEFTDYTLRAEFCAAPGTNSGIFLRTPARPTDPTKDCYELNIAPPDNPFPTGSLVGRQKADVEPAEGWRQFEVTLMGPRVTVLLDGQQVLDYTDPQPLGRGRIGLQLNEGEVAFRRILLKPLGTEPIFNGKDLAGWNTYPEMESRFTVREGGELHVAGGRGQLETQQSYGDFLLQLEVRTNASHLNSGIFFRCIPGETMNGYEAQIHNGFHDGDRTRPIDCGTGGIFRRQDARVVAANDQQWFAMTLVAQGRHMAVWVNGLQVTDWTDTRDQDPNPRNGLRLEPGTIMLQGHDPTTDISFRNLRIRADD